MLPKSWHRAATMTIHWTLMPCLYEVVLRLITIITALETKYDYTSIWKHAHPRGPVARSNKQWTVVKHMIIALRLSVGICHLILSGRIHMADLRLNKIPAIGISERWNPSSALLYVHHSSLHWRCPTTTTTFMVPWFQCRQSSDKFQTK